MRRFGAALSAAWLAGYLLAAPARADDPLASAAALVLHEPEHALAALDAVPVAGREQSETRYLRARLLERLGRDVQALAALPEAAAPLPEGARLDVRRRRAVLLARTGDCSAAALLFASLAETGDATPTVDAAAVECALAAGDIAGARKRLAALAALGADVFELRVRLVDVLQARAASADAARELRALLVEHPEHAAVAEAEKRFALSGGAPFTIEERFERAEHLMSARRPEDALAELGAKPPRDKSTHARWHHARGMALYSTRTAYAEAASVLARAAQLGGPTRASDSFHSARALSRAGRDRAAIGAFRVFAERHRESRFASEARYLAARLELLLGLPRGEKNMRAFVEGPRDRSEPEFVREGLFDLAMRAFDRRRYRDAEASFQRCADRGGDVMARARSAYWTARAAEAGGRKAIAIARYRTALAVEPLHWYALLAAGRLRALGAEPGEPFATAKSLAPPPVTPPSVPDPLLESEVAFHRRLGLLEDAVAALVRAEPALRRAGATDAALVHAYHALGEHARPHTFATRSQGDALAHPPSPPNAWAWAAAYARPLADTVTLAAGEEGLDGDLLYAIMRKESAFDPGVVSYADAIGLMQILPKTAEKIARARGEPYRRELLFDGVTSIRWAAHLLHGLHHEFDDQSVLAIAAYNAGAHKVRPWLVRESRGGKIELDLFVERIPVEQTRNYVRRVVGNWARYRYLADPTRGWPLTLPTHLQP